MKVILGCDPLLQPLTGIGHYTQKLAKSYLRNDQISEIALFAHGKFFNHSLVDSCIINCTTTTNTSHTPLNLLSNIRGYLAKSTAAVKLYSLLSPIVNKYALGNYQDYIFHSPNFILPNFDGKKIVTVHDLSTIKYPEFHPKARINFVNKQLESSISQADHIITDSEFVKREIIEAFSLSNDKVSAIHLGADSAFEPRSASECLALHKYNIEYKKFFLFVSTIEPRKNIKKLLTAFSRYRENIKNTLPLILVGGNGWNNDVIQKMIDDLTAKGWVKHLGYVAQNDIPILYSSAKALLFPSIYEGFGLPVLEAMQSGTPVLTCKNSSMSEITQENAALVDVDDIYQMSELIEQFSIDDQWTSTLIRNGVIRAKDFSWRKCAQETIDVYQSLG